MAIVIILWDLCYLLMRMLQNLHNFIYDVSNEVSNRMSQFPHSTSDSCLDQTIVSDLIKMLASTNCLVGLFRHASQKLSEPNNPGYKLQLLCQRTNDSREYSNPTSDDIGGLIVGDIGAYRSERDIIIESSQTLYRNLNFIQSLWPYNILFYFHLVKTVIAPTLALQIISNISGKRQRVPMRGFYAYVIQEREYGEDTLTKGGRLYQQFLVDAFANIEEDRLDYIRMNQNDLRSDLYQNINAMAICRAYGNPDLFITFTCNTKWPEIERELDKSRGYKPEDKPDIITRVFRTKLLDMLKFIKSGAPFGETIADVHSIEFQKRGLPHTHILVWLASKFKFRTSADIDSIVSAEIPDKNIDPLCHDIVCKFMLHGPCGVAKPGAQCMSGNVCTKSFPKKFRNSTTLDENGFVYYRSVPDAKAQKLFVFHVADILQQTQLIGDEIKNGLRLSVKAIAMRHHHNLDSFLLCIVWFCISLLQNGRTALQDSKYRFTLMNHQHVAIKKTHIFPTSSKTALIVWDEAPMYFHIFLSKPYFY
uniref:Helitron helicase-like domain-containing protein n=1 Tax=Salix viminalis TaxID=40686 RepID=A0A6N2M1C4_SALVM